MTILGILLLVFLLIDIYITIKGNEETMETKDNKKLVFDNTDLVICIRCIEFLINSAKDSEKYLHGDMLKASREVTKQAKKTLKKLKAIDNNNKKIFRGEK